MYVYQDKFELYRVVMPHTLREFAKETEGKTYEAVVAAANVSIYYICNNWCY